MLHELKTLLPYYNDIRIGNKTFELRKDDRNYKKGDWLRLKEFDNGKFTGREIDVRVLYVLRNVEDYGLKKGFVILGIN